MSKLSNFTNDLDKSENDAQKDLNAFVEKIDSITSSTIEGGYHFTRIAVIISLHSIGDMLECKE